MRLAITGILIFFLVPLILSLQKGQKTSINEEGGFSVQVNKSFGRMLLVFFVFSFPIGGFAAFSVLLFVYAKEPVSVIMGPLFSAVCCGIICSFWLYFHKKKVIVMAESLIVYELLRKVKYCNLNEIGHYSLWYQTVKIYDKKGRKICAVTALYSGYTELLGWLKQADIICIKK